MYGPNSRHYGEGEADPLEMVCHLCHVKSTEHCAAVSNGWACDRVARLLGAGYDYNVDPWHRTAYSSGGLMERVIVSKKVTARKVWTLHAGTVQPGEVYSMRVVRTVNIDGESRHSRYRWVR